MKTNFILAALFIVCLNNNLSAQRSVDVNTKVITSFERHFEGATVVNWGQFEQLSFATFLYEEKSWIAYFNQQGDLLASARKIREVSQLPVVVQQSLKNFQIQKKAKTGPLKLGHIYEVLETGGGTFYYIPMESSNQTLTVSITNNGYATINKKHNRMPTLIEANKALLAKKN